jgi:hypothetical protein
MTTLLAVLSIIAAAVFFAVLCGFLLRLGKRLGSVAAKLANVHAAATQMRNDCALISPSVEAMNQNLYEVAAQLSDLGDVSERLAEATGR